jgi:hypothetical protein
LSTEREIYAAEAAMRDAGDVLDAAQNAHRHAVGAVNGVMQRWIKRITGPIAPIGDRTVRRSCALAEIPAYLGDTDASGSVRAIVGERMYVTNSHLLIDVDSVEGLERIQAHPRVVIGERAEKLTREDTPVEHSDTLTIRRFTSDAGNIIANARYTTIIEDLFPGVEWFAAKLGQGRHLHAVVEGELVAVLMPIRPSVLEGAVKA